MDVKRIKNMINVQRPKFVEEIKYFVTVHTKTRTTDKHR